MSGLWRKASYEAVGGVLALFSAAILLTIYGAWVCYPLEIAALSLEKVVYMKAETIHYNFSVLMTYLTGPFQWQLSLPSFSASTDGLKHFQDVKYLFHLVQLVFVLSLPAVYRLAKSGFPSRFRPVFFRAAVVPIGIGWIGLWLGFDQFFILFHQVLFPGDQTWLFNPLTDPVIFILPQAFFLHCFVAFFLCYQLLCWWCWWLCGRQSEKKPSQ